jgi:hypothetical protein
MIACGVSQDADAMGILVHELPQRLSLIAVYRYNDQVSTVK